MVHRNHGGGIRLDFDQTRSYKQPVINVLDLALWMPFGKRKFWRHQMKNGLFRTIGKSALPTLLAGALLAFSAPVAALAQSRGGGAHSGGRSFSSGSSRGFSSGGRTYGGGRDYDRGHGGGYYRGGGLYLGLGAPYAYGPAYSYGYVAPPAPCGFYDQAGYWHAGPCYGPPAGY